MGAKVRAVACEIEKHLRKIEAILPSEYKLTLIFRHTGDGDADIIMTVDDFAKASDALARWQQLSDKCEHGIVNGDWCEACNRDYRAALMDPENGGQ